MTDEEMEFYERALDNRDKIINKLRKENEVLREKITDLEKEIDELQWKEECEIMRREENE